MTAVQSQEKHLPVEVFREMERRDETQILKELQGDLLSEFVYSIQIQGKSVTNLSYAGIKEAIRRRGDIEILDIKTESDEKEFRALIRVRDHQNKIDVTGASSANRTQPFAYVLAVNKAERNAFAKLLPSKWIASMINEYLQRAREKGQAAATERTKTTSSIPESTVSTGAIKEPENSSLTQGPISVRGWKVPLIKDQATPEQITKGVRQTPLIRDLKSYGMLNILNDEISIVPEIPIPIETALIEGFLIRKVLEQMQLKHPGLSYELSENGNGLLTAVLIRGQLQDQQIKELVSSARWAFEKSMAANGGKQDDKPIL